MKKVKIFSLVVAACVMGTMVFGCSKASAPADETSTTTTAEVTVAEETEKKEETKETVAEETEAAPDTGAEVVTDENNDENEEEGTSIVVNQYLLYTVNEETIDGEDKIAYIPFINIDNDEIREVNNQMGNFAGLVFEDWSLSNSSFRVFENDGIMSICQLNCDMYDGMCVNAVTIDINEGKVLSNKEIMDLVGYTEDQLYTDASATIENMLVNDYGLDEETRNDRISNDSEGYFADALEKTFSKEVLNSNMIMFIGPDGTLCLCSKIVSMGGPLTTTEIYDVNGNMWTMPGCGYAIDTFGDIIVPNN